MDFIQSITMLAIVTLATWTILMCFGKAVRDTWNCFMIVTNLIKDNHEKVISTLDFQKEIFMGAIEENEYALEQFILKLRKSKRGLKAIAECTKRAISSCPKNGLWTMQ